MPPEADEQRRRDEGERAEVAELEEALTLAAAAPGRRRLERLEELLLLRVTETTRD